MMNTLSPEAETSAEVLPQHIDATMISCFRSCPQKFYLEFVRGLRPPGLSIDLHAGACFALALESFYHSFISTGDLMKSIARAHGDYMHAWGDFESDKLTAKTKDRVWSAVWNDAGDEQNQGYLNMYPPQSDHVKPVILEGSPTVEYTFAVPLEPAGTAEGLGKFPLHPCGDPFIYCGRLDALAEWSGKMVGRDEKTTGRSIGRNWAEQWDLRSQFIGQTWALQESGLDIDTIVVRGLAIQKTQFVHAEAIKVYSNDLRKKWLEQLRRDLWKIRRAWDEQYFDFNLAESCTAYGQCQFAPLCSSPTPEQWYSLFEVRRWNPLLKDPVGIRQPTQRIEIDDTLPI